MTSLIVETKMEELIHRIQSGLIQWIKKKVESEVMKKIAIYDPAMCCSTGVCGASVDTELLRVATVIENLKQNGADICRYNLSSEPSAFVENKLISEYLKQNGPEVLPITLVDGEVVKTKGYPTNEEFSQWTGLTINGTTTECSCCCQDGCC